MKKFIRVVSICLAMLTFVLVPVSADDFTNLEGWINLLDYTTVNNSGSNTFTNSGVFEAKFYFPYQTSLGTVDGIVWASRSFTVTNNNGDPLTVTYLGSNLYRIYGSSPNWHSSYLYLKFTVSSSASMQIKSLHMANSNYMHVAEVGTLTVGSSSYTMSSSTSSVKHIFPTSSDGGYGAFTASVSCPNWKKYDFLDVYFTVFTETLDSIYARFAGIDVPFSVSYLGGTPGLTYGESNNKIMVRLDLRGLDRVKTDVPVLEFSGTYDADHGNNQIVLVQVNGYVVTDMMSPLFFYFQKLESHLSSLFSTMAQRQDAYQADLEDWQQGHEQFLIDQFSIITSRLSGISSAITSMSNTLKVSIDTVGVNVVDGFTSLQSTVVSWFTTISDQLDELLHPDTSGSEQFEDDIASQATEMQDISETLDSVTKPPIEDFDISIDEYFEGQDTVVYASPLSAFFENSIFIVMFLMSMIAVTVSYGLYGKR